jgi:hypothetical protein
LKVTQYEWMRGRISQSIQLNSGKASSKGVAEHMYFALKSHQWCFFYNLVSRSLFILLNEKMAWWRLNGGSWCF